MKKKKKTTAHNLDRRVSPPLVPRSSLGREEDVGNSQPNRRGHFNFFLNFSFFLQLDVIEGQTNTDT